MFYLNSRSLRFLETHPQLYAKSPHSLAEVAISQHSTTQSQFHLLMRQRLEELPIESLLKAYPLYAHWLNQLETLAPEIFTEQPNQIRLWDYLAQQLVEDVCLQTTFDLVIFAYPSATVINWVTQPIMPQEVWEQSWRTQLTLFLLFKTNASRYRPEQLRLTTWFLNSNETPQKLSLDYSLEQVQHFENRLERIVQFIHAPVPLPAQASESTFNIDEIPEVEI